MYVTSGDDETPVQVFASWLDERAGNIIAE